jgi:hypothetical protein
MQLTGRLFDPSSQRTVNTRPAGGLVGGVPHTWALCRASPRFGTGLDGEGSFLGLVASHALPPPANGLLYPLPLLQARGRGRTACLTGGWTGAESSFPLSGLLTVFATNWVMKW